MGSTSGSSAWLARLIEMVACSITGLVRNRRHRSSTVARAAVSWSASTTSRMALPIRTWLTWPNPSVGSDRSMVVPAGSAIPGSKLTSIRASQRISGRPFSGGNAGPIGKGETGDGLVGSDVAGPGGGDHLDRQRQRGRGLAPPAPLQPVPQRLLVVGGGRGPWGPLVGRPKPGRVRGQHLVADGQPAVDQAQLKRGVGHDDASLGGPGRSPPVGGDADLAGLGGQVGAHQVGRLPVADVLVVAAGRLGGGCEDRLGERLAALEAG